MLLKDLIERRVGSDLEKRKALLEYVGISNALLKKIRNGYIPSVPVLKLIAQHFCVSERGLINQRTKRSPSQSKG